MTRFEATKVVLSVQNTIMQLVVKEMIVAEKRGDICTFAALAIFGQEIGRATSQVLKDATDAVFSEGVRAHEIQMQYESIEANNNRLEEMMRERVFTQKVAC